jgi:hypothetical protein
MAVAPTPPAEARDQQLILLGQIAPHPVRHGLAVLETTVVIRDGVGRIGIAVSGHLVAGVHVAPCVRAP